MTRYQERLDQDITAIRQTVDEIGDLVEAAFRGAIHAILSHDRRLASAIILGDLPINRRVRQLDAMCHAFVARHLPSAGHLRFVSSVLRMSVELERIGDYAVTLAREQAQLAEPPTETVARDIELLGEQAADMLHQSVLAFNEQDEGRARGTMARARSAESTFGRIFSDLVEAGERQERSVRDLFALLVILNRIGRVADQSKNICEETVFAATGATKQPKVYQVLFVDERNDLLSPMAAAFATKNFGHAGRFSSAGWSPARHFDPKLEVFLEKQGYDVSEQEPVSLDSLRDSLDETHVIVSLGQGARAHFDPLPFHTVLLEWDVSIELEGVDQQRAEALLARAFKQLSLEIRELMELLRGEHNL